MDRWRSLLVYQAASIFSAILFAATISAIAATASAAPVTILGAQAVNKSYPSFWEAYKRLGGFFDVL